MSKQTACTAEAFPIKKGGQAREQTHGLLINVRQTRDGKTGGKGKVAQIW